MMKNTSRIAPWNRRTPAAGVQYMSGFQPEKMTRESSEVLKAKRRKSIEKNAKAVELSGPRNTRRIQGKKRSLNVSSESRARRTTDLAASCFQDGTAPAGRKSVAVETLLKTFEGTAPPKCNAHPEMIDKLRVLAPSYQDAESLNPAEARDATRGPRSPLISASSKEGERQQ